MLKLLRSSLFFCLLFSVINLKSQVNVKDSLLNFTMVNVSASWNIPQADLAQRFGNFASAGIAGLRKSKKGWLWGGSAQFHFGNKVKERNMISGITVYDGFVVSSDGTLSDIQYLMRGFQGSLSFGKILPFGGRNPNCGFYVLVNGGFIQHKIRFELERKTNVPSLTGEYKKGYDRMSNGWTASPSLGYLFLSNKRTINFFAQVDFNYASTVNRRSYNFDTGLPDERIRNESFFSFRFGWVLPIYRSAPADFFYF